MAASETRSSWILPIRAVPNARRNEIVGVESGELKIKVRAVPEDGKANKELLKFLSKEVGLSRSMIVLQSGETSRHKRFRIDGLDRERLFEKLGIADTL